MGADRKTLLVANPTAQSGKAKRSIDLALEALRAAGLDTEFFATLPDGATVAGLAQRLEVQDVDRVVYLGGDGTFAEAAKGIILARERCGLDVPLGMLPMGTANNQGRSFGIMAGSKALDRNVAIIVEGGEQWLDVGRIEAIDSEGAVITHDLWFDSFGVGLSAEILAQRNKDREFVGQFPVLSSIYRDKMVYAGAVVRGLVRSIVAGDHFTCTVEVDGEEHRFEGCTDVIIKGTLLYAGDWIFHENAAADDGKFELVVIRGHAQLLTKAISNHKRNPISDAAREAMGIGTDQIIQGKEFCLELHRPENLTAIRAQIDGEEFVPADRFRISNLFHHLRIIVPDNPHWI